MDPLELAQHLVNIALAEAAIRYGANWDGMRSQVGLFILSTPIGFIPTIDSFWACCDLVYQGIPKELEGA